MTLSPDVAASYARIIDSILATSDLTTISAKRIRKGLQAAVDYDIAPQKDAITELIMARFDQFNSEATNDSTEARDEERPVSGDGAEVSQEHSPRESEVQTAVHTTKRVQTPDESELSDVSDISPPKKKARKESIVEDDAAYAARLQAEENGRARSTRGAGTKRKAPAKKPAAKKKKSAAKVEDSDVDSGSAAESKRINRSGGFHKPMILSQPLSELLGETELSRPQTVKKIWAYVKAHRLQDPNDKRQIRCDEAMKAVFKQDRVHMFTMNKILNQNLYTNDE